jgi:hypothetical protein
MKYLRAMERIPMMKLNFGTNLFKNIHLINIVEMSYKIIFQIQTNIKLFQKKELELELP